MRVNSLTLVLAVFAWPSSAHGQSSAAPAYPWAGAEQCAQCHEDHWGKRLRAERISQGHANGFPIYRLEWQTLGSLHRRLRACFQGVRAEPFPSGTPEFVNLELYLAWRAQGYAMARDVQGFKNLPGALTFYSGFTLEDTSIG